jgi:uncharacterized Zn finger protein
MAARWRSRYDDGGFPPYVPVASRRALAAKAVAALAKKGQATSPVRIEGRKIAATFWGKAWCENLERYSDLENRLPRGRTYVRNGSVIDLQISKGQVKALVQGSKLYKVTVSIDLVEEARWAALTAECAGKVDSVVELLSGRLSTAVMDVMTRRETGLFPAPRNIHMRCSCPDAAGMCKHIAAVLYGVGARLDSAPELLFELRGKTPEDLVTAGGAKGLLRAGKAAREVDLLDTSDLGSLFGIEMEGGAAPAGAQPRAKAKAKPKAPAAARGKKAPAARARVKKAGGARQSRSGSPGRREPNRD